MFVIFWALTLSRFHEFAKKPTSDAAKRNSLSVDKILSRLNIDSQTKRKIKQLTKSHSIPEEVLEESDEVNGGYVRCRPFIVSRRSLKSVVDRYAQRAIFDASKDEQDSTLMAYQMLPNAIDMKTFRNHVASGNVQQFDTNDDDDDDKKTTKQVKGRKKTVNKKKTKNSIKAKSTKKTQHTKKTQSPKINVKKTKKAINGKNKKVESNNNYNPLFEDEASPEMIGVSNPGAQRSTQIYGKEKVSPAVIARNLKLSQPEQLRLHLKAKPKIPLCRNTIILI